MKLRLLRLERTSDGSGEIGLDLQAITDDGTVIPGYHKVLRVDGEAIDAALALPTTAQTVSALKQIIQNALPEWAVAKLQATVDKNTVADSAAIGLADFIDSVGGMPKDFDL